MELKYAQIYLTQEPATGEIVWLEGSEDSPD
jgi:hypothetical protein